MIKLTDLQIEYQKLVADVRKHMTFVLSSFFFRKAGITQSEEIDFHSLLKRTQWSIPAARRFLGALEAVGVVEIQDTVIKPKALSIQPSRLTQIFNDLHWRKNVQTHDWLTGRREGLPDAVENLCSEVSDVLRGLLRYNGLVVNQFFQDHVLDLTLKENKAQLEAALFVKGDQIFDCYESHPDLLKVYSDGFASVNFGTNEQFVVPSIGPPPKTESALLDVGAGAGQLACALGRSGWRNVAAYDLPGTARSLRTSREFWERYYGFKPEWKFGSFFDDTKELSGLKKTDQYDMILLCWILHDWDDRPCADILTKVAAHLSVGGRVGIVEYCDDNRNSSRAKFSDFIMLLMANGFERNLADYAKLLKQAGLVYLDRTTVDQGRSIIWATGS